MKVRNFSSKYYYITTFSKQLILSNNLNINMKIKNTFRPDGFNVRERAKKEEWDQFKACNRL